MKDSTTARDYGVGALLVLLILALTFVLARFVITSAPSDARPVHLDDERIGNLSAPAPTAGAGRRVAVAQAVDPWLAAERHVRIQQLTGRFDPARDAQFARLPDSYTDGESEYLLRIEAASAVRALIDSARADGVILRVRSATRNFNRQAQIWGAKWRGDRTLSNGINLGQQSTMPDSAKARMILLYSSMPGTSRHHWGTDVDFNAFDNSYFAQGKGLAEYEWLQANAAHFGFYQPYTSKATGRTGYEEEKWHWSFLPLSQNLLARYQAEVGYADITGFEGAEQAQAVGAIENYVLGVAADLLPTSTK